MPPGTWIQVDPAVRGQPIEQAGARWLLRTEGSEPMEVERLSLLKLELRLDARRQLLGFEGLLARETALGDMTYPAGTRVLSGGLRAAGAQPGDLLFSASRGRVARRAGGTDVAAGSSVLQAPDGAVRAVLSTARPACWMWPRSGRALGRRPRGRPQATPGRSAAGAFAPLPPVRDAQSRPAAKRWDNSQLSPRAAQRAAVPSCSLIETKSWPLTCRSLRVRSFPCCRR